MTRQYVQHGLIAAGILSFGFLLTIAELRQMLTHGETPQERARGAAGLGHRRDTPSTLLLLDAMEDQSPLVRAQAAVAVKKILGADFYFDPNAPPAQRDEVIAKYRSLWEAWREKTGYGGELIVPENDPLPQGGSG